MAVLVGVMLQVVAWPQARVICVLLQVDGSQWSLVTRYPDFYTAFGHGRLAR